MLATRHAAVLVLAGMILAGCQAIPTRQVTTASVAKRPVSVPELDHLGLVVKKPAEIRFHLLPVGSGMCHLVECPGAGAPSPMLIDCGSTAQSPTDLTREQAVAKAREILNGRPAIVVLSHSDADHSNYVPDIVPLPAAVRSVWLGGKLANYPPAVRDWVALMKAKGVAVNLDFPAGYSNDGNAVANLACGDARTFILTVNAGAGANPSSMMLSIDHGDTHMIFPGDATAVAQDSAIANYPEPGILRSDLVEASHHGAESNGSNNERWADATAPRYLFVSAGQAYYHPRCGAIENFRTDRLRKAPTHRFICGFSDRWSDIQETGEAIYNTEDVKTIVITANADPTSIAITCNGKECN